MMIPGQGRKLTAEQVHEIRRGSDSNRVTATAFGVSHVHIIHIRKGRRWGSLMLKGPLGVQDTFLFGKHRNEAVEEVIVDDPSYVEWCLDEVEGFELDEEATQLLATSLRSVQ